MVEKSFYYCGQASGFPLWFTVYCQMNCVYVSILPPSKPICDLLSPLHRKDSNYFRPYTSLTSTERIMLISGCTNGQKELALPSITPKHKIRPVIDGRLSLG